MSILVLDEVRPFDSSTPAPVTTAGVAAFDADIARAVDERTVAVQRATEAAGVTPVTTSGRADDESEDSDGELTLGQLVDLDDHDRDQAVTSASHGLPVCAIIVVTGVSPSFMTGEGAIIDGEGICLLYTSPSPRD